MRIKTLLLTVLACLILTPLLAQSDAESDLKEALRTLQAGKRDLIEQTMMLTEEERAAFWPLYEKCRLRISIMFSLISFLFPSRILIPVQLALYSHANSRPGGQQQPHAR